jgi:hypothetical protein
MADMPDNVDLKWIGQTLLAIQGEQAAMRRQHATEIADLIAATDKLRRQMDVRLEEIRDTLGVVDARLGKLEHSHEREMRRVDERITALEGK